MGELQAGQNASFRARLTELRRLLRSDARADGYARPLTVLVRALTTIRFQAVVLYRLSHLAHHYSPGLASVVKYVNSVLTGCDIAAAATIGPGLRLFHPNGVVIGPDVVVGADCMIQQHVTLGRGGSGSPVLDDGVVIGPGAVVIGGVHIGAGARVGSNAVVTKSIPAGELWAGVPAVRLRTI